MNNSACLSETAVYETHLPVGKRRQGKVRDIYQLPATESQPPRVLIVASDRISAFDVVLPNPVPGKGRLLTAISSGWFDLLRPAGLIADHVLSTDPADVDGITDEQREQLASRIMIGRAAEVIPVEFVVRGYLAGSGWNDYVTTGSVCGIALPEGLQRADRLPQPVFTPSTKADVGHDENIDFDKACEIAGRDVMERLRDISLKLYSKAAEHAESCGLILADTKFEFGYALDDDGRRTDEIILIDEIFTPDSSRYWPLDEYQPGREQDSIDKQYVRNHLLTLVEAGQWDKTPPGPELPQDVINNTIAKYEEARQRLFG